MKRYYIALILVTLVLTLASFVVLWCGGPYQAVMSLLPLYFAAITGGMHYVVIKSLHKDPRTFVKNFLGLTVGSLFLHLAVLFIWSLTHIATAKPFILAFCIGYAVYLVFETLSLILTVKKLQK